jgi:hypothetical protein
MFSFVKDQMRVVGSTFSRVLQSQGFLDTHDAGGIVPDQWFRDVDHIIAPGGSLARHFYSSAVTILLGLSANLAITQSMFMEEMQIRFKGIWTEPFHKACESFFQQAMEALPDRSHSSTLTLRLPESPDGFHNFDRMLHSEHLKTKFSDQFRDAISDALLLKLGRPSIFLYNSAIEPFLSSSHDPHCSADSFLHNLEMSLGSTGGWCAGLAEPMSQWYSAARADPEAVVRLHLPSLESIMEEDPNARSKRKFSPPLSSLHCCHLCIHEHASPSLLPCSAATGPYDERDVSGTTADPRHVRNGVEGATHPPLVLLPLVPQHGGKEHDLDQWVTR